MEEKENDMDIEINNNIKNKIELKEYYEDKEIGLFFQTNVENKIDKIIGDLNHYYDIGDWRKCTILIKKITLCGIFRAFKKEKKKRIIRYNYKKFNKQYIFLCNARYKYNF